MKPTKPMAVTSVKLLLESLTCEVDGLAPALKALCDVPAPSGHRIVVDGPRRLAIRPSGVCGASFAGSVWIADPVWEFGDTGDALWWYDHSRGGLPVEGDLRQRVLVLERAVVSCYGRDPIRAYRAIRLLAGMHNLPVPALGARQGVPEAVEG